MWIRADAPCQLGHSMNMGVIAEGVETLEQIDFLAHLGCDEVQGYFFSRPISADEFLAYVEAYEPRSASDLTRGDDQPSAMSGERKRA